MGDLPFDISGLSSEEAKKRLKKYGYNRVKERSRLADWEILPKSV
jgi:beta-lactam-binding protein with PASTA domain